MKYHFYADPQHGWLRVPKTELKELGIEDEISYYSYQLNNWVYLEEDVDAEKYLDARKTAGYESPSITCHHCNNQSHIRSYDFYAN